MWRTNIYKRNEWNIIINGCCTLFWHTYTIFQISSIFGCGIYSINGQICLLYYFSGIFHIQEKLNIIMVGNISGIFHFLKFHIPWNIPGIFQWGTFFFEPFLWGLKFNQIVKERYTAHQNILSDCLSLFESIANLVT